MGEVTKTEPINGYIFMNVIPDAIKNLKLPELSFPDKLTFLSDDRISNIELIIQRKEPVTCIVRYWRDKDPENPKSGLEMYEQYYYLRANLEWYVAFERFSESSVIGVAPLTVHS